MDTCIVCVPLPFICALQHEFLCGQGCSSSTLVIHIGALLLVKQAMSVARPAAHMQQHLSDRTRGDVKRPRHVRQITDTFAFYKSE